MTQEAVISHKQNIAGPMDLLLAAKAKSKKMIPVT
jgi:hypothetical protein